MSNEEIARVTANGRFFERWTNVRVKMEANAFANEFALSIVEENNDGTSSNFARVRSWNEQKLKNADDVTIALAGRQVIAGKIEARTVAYNSKMCGIMVQGRSKAGEAVDASAPVSTGQYRGYSFRQIAQSVLGRVGLQMRIENPPPGIDRVFDNVAIAHGETSAAFLERLARLRGLWVRSDEQGTVVFGTVGNRQTIAAEIEEGRNVFEFRATINDTGVFAAIMGHGQRPGSDEEHGARRTQVSARSENPYMSGRPNRELVLATAEPVTQQDAQTRVDRANADRIGTHVVVNVTVQGWHMSSGGLWKVNERVKVKSPIAFPNGSGEQTLAIKTVEFLQDSYAGTTTQIELVLPEALGAPLGPNRSGTNDAFAGGARPASAEA